jgi:iron complex transport system substrate-binding protein
MKRSFSIFLCILFLGGILAACAPRPTATPAVSVEATSVALNVTDGLGRKLTLNPSPKRVVSLAPSNTEILFAVGAGDILVGRDDFSNYPEQVKSMPSVGGSMGDYNLEEIISLNPDLVLAAGINTPEQVKSIEDSGIPVYYLPNPTDLEGMFQNLEIVGLLTYRQQQAADLVASLRERVTAVEEKLQGVSTHPKVFYELDGSDPSKPWTSGKGTFMDLLIQMAGGENVGASMDSDWGQLSLEALIIANPDVILLGDANYGMTPDQVAARAGWGQIQAVQTGQVLPFNDDMASRPGPRLVDALEILARILHQEKFE